ncbi:hypothetical protein E2562_014982 [Oryza meyeriana var. granulata]|uniref:HMA domain-containing protein n=1 Tax=Oryza meyeriana var. granulata TaxID=110450 RepID=A0A6G1EJX9_9ORYZ|nr:hypothetical protein E2562_014982 [Oryza meyeriana var. granulata]
MPTLVIAMNLQCCRCSTKIQKLLCCMQERGEFEIEKIVYEKKTVVVSGPFDAEKLSCKLWCKAGKIIKDIKIKTPPEPPVPTKPVCGCPTSPSCHCCSPYPPYLPPAMPYRPVLVSDESPQYGACAVM